MKTIRLIDGIPSERIQKLEESIYEILMKLDEENIATIVAIHENRTCIEEVEKQLIKEFIQGLRDTLEINGYKYLMHEQDIIEHATSYVKTYVVN